MASCAQAQAENVRCAVSSISTCTPATTVLFRELVLPAGDAKQAAPLPSAPTTESRTNKAAGRATKTTAKGTSKKVTPSKGAKEELSAKDKARLASHVLNAALKELGDAAKTPTGAPAAPARTGSQQGELAKRASRTTLRRSLSAPPTPLHSRTPNRVATSPATTVKPVRSNPSLASTTGCLSMVECARVAISALRVLHTAGEVTLPELQLETALSTLVSRLTALGMLDHATKELRTLKQWLDGRIGKPATAAKKAANRPAQSDTTTATTTRFSDLVDFRGFKPSDPAFSLVITAQIQAIRIVSLMKKPQHAESVVGFLLSTKSAKSSCSPLAHLIEYGGSSPANRTKAARQLDTLSKLLLSLAPSISSSCDDEALEPRLSISPSSAFDVLVLGLEARIWWWGFAGHQGDVDKDVLLPFARTLSAFIRRSPALDSSMYTACVGAFERVLDLIRRKELQPAETFRSPLASIHQSLGAVAREARHFKEAVGWVTQLKGLMRPGDDSEASRCSVAALLLSLQLRDPTRHLEAEGLLTEVLAGIQGGLSGDSAELEELLTNISLARRSAMNLLASRNGTTAAAAEQQQISTDTRDLLEAFVLQCPRFCFRWLGKPPASNGNTKDFLRYEQRRQVLAKSIHHMLDSAFMVIKTLIDEGRISWSLMDSTLTDCLVLLDYMGDLGSSATNSSEAWSSHFVKVSHFFFMQHSVLRQTSVDHAKDPESLRALRRSIECVKHRPAREKDKAQLVTKLERLAEMYRAQGRVGDALGALQAIRTSLVDDGVLAAVVQSLGSQSPAQAWGGSGAAKTVVLSRTLVSIARLEQVWIDWAVDLSEQERLAVLEHRLHFVLLASGGGGSSSRDKDSRRVTLADKCVESLLKTYYPTRFPIRRLRTLLGLLAANMDDPEQFGAVQSQAAAVVGVIETRDLGEDAPLQGYLKHYLAHHSSLVGLQGASDSDLAPIEQALSSWRSLVDSCGTSALEDSIDDASALLTHLRSIADLARTVGAESTRMAALELASRITTLSAASSPEDKVGSGSSLALVYVELGQSLRAESVLEDCHRHVQDARPVMSSEAVAQLHLAHAEFCVLTGNFDKAEAHFKQAQLAVAPGEGGLRPFRSRRKDLVAYASLLCSMIASKKGEAHHALVHARETVRLLFRDWTKLEAAASSPRSINTTSSHIERPAAGGSPDTTTEDVTAVATGADTHPTDTSTAGPEFWRLLHPLFRSMSHLSAIYAHLGMFQETVYYAEQARKIAQSTNARLYLAQCEAWLGSVYLKAGRLDDSLRLVNLSSSRLQASDRTCLSVTLACQLADLYRDLKESDSGLAMLARAEETMKLLAQGAQGSGDANTSQVSSDVAELNAGVSKLSIQEKQKPTARKATRKATTVAKAPARKTTRKAAAAAPDPTTAKAPKPALAALPVDDIILSTLKSAVILHRAVSLVNRRDWASARAVLQESQALSKLSKSSLLEMVARSACLYGQSQEQMTRHAVFSVIQDSTLSFPAVAAGSAGVADKSPDRLSLTPAPAAASKKPRDQRTKQGRQFLDFLENLQAAHECLLEAHAAAAVNGDGALVHRIAGMLQSATLLLSAACPAKPRVLGLQGFATCSVEAAQNLTWRREQKALLLEKNAGAPRQEGTGLEWPVLPSAGVATESSASASPTSLTSLSSPLRPRSSLGSPAGGDMHVNMARFQRDYIDIIPRDWTVVSISLSDNRHDLCISRLQAGHSPFVIRLPLERGGSGPRSGGDADEVEDSGVGADEEGDGEEIPAPPFTFQRGRAELLELVRLANASCHDARDMTAPGAKRAWWAGREELDGRLGRLLENMEQVWLGGFRGIFSQQQRCPDLLARFQKSFHNILDRHLPSRRSRGKRAKAAAAAASSAASRITLDPRVLELFVALGDSTAPGCDFDDALMDLLYFVVDILQFHGERNAYDEIDFDSMCVETYDALHAYHSALKSKKASTASGGSSSSSSSNENENSSHTVLVLDKALHVFPWESLPCMQGLATSRVPSLACLRRLILDQRKGAAEPAAAEGNVKARSGHHVSASSGAYILNPGGDLKTTQATFEKPLARALAAAPSPWARIVGRPPTEVEFEAALAERDILLYFGHGSGAQYIRGRSVRRLDRCRAAVWLMGCSSASLADVGDFESHGPVWNYLMAGCPAVVGTLWDVTDRDIDRLAARAFEEWGLVDRGTFKEDKPPRSSSKTKAAAAAACVDVAGGGKTCSLVQAVAKARDACRFRYLTAAAVCVYGIPVYVDR